MKLNQKLVRSLFSSTDYNRGMVYYRQNRVFNIRYFPSEVGFHMECDVQGSQLYRVSFEELPEDYISINCTCPRFQQTRRCKHLAAAMIACLNSAPGTSVPRTDRYARAMLQCYLEKSQRQQPEIRARLVPQIQTGPFLQGDYPSFSFRVGREKLYVVRNIQEFLSNVDEGKTTTYGKALTLDHSIAQFDGHSQEIIRLLMNEYSQYRSLRNHDYFGYTPPNPDKNLITLTGHSFDCWFDLLSVEPVEEPDGGSIRFAQRDPQVGIQLEEKAGAAVIQISAPYRFFGSRSSLYALGGGELLRCSVDFRERVFPLLSQGSTTMQLSLQDLPTFCGCVLPELGDLVEVEDPDQLLQSYLPEECTPCFYFDMEQDVLWMKLVFRYGEKEFTPADRPSEGDGIRRDMKTESGAVTLAQRYFEQANGRFVLEGEEEVFSFLTQTLDTFRQHGDIFLSDRLQRKRIQPTGASVGISVSDGLLSLKLDTGSFPPEELSALYQSLLLRRKYHRLPDGRFLELNGSSFEKMAELAQMLQLSKRELSKGSVTLPAYRGLYIDSLLSDSEGVQVSRDRQFRSMIRNFKSVSESDFCLPENLETVLRPYQKIGFQWLKTLESYGFGGILADEMGLGKTLQVIAFLATVPREKAGGTNLVVCPASLIYNWGEELQKYAPQLSVCLILGSAAERKALRSGATEADVWVTSYELLRQDLADYENGDFYCCVLDEAQHIKNQSTLISKAVKRIPCRQRFVLTGTPVENRLSELWNLFDFLMSGYLFSHSAFREKLENPILKSKNPDAAVQLRRLVQPFLLRRLKSDVLKELPPKQEHIRRISLSETEQKTYYSCVQAVRETIGDGQGKLQILAALTRLRQICCDPNLCFENYEGPASKLDACVELCEAMVENGHQILLFSQFTSMLDRIRPRLDALSISSFTLQGSTSKDQRAKMVKAFNAGDASVFLISLKAGGTGLNLTAADVVIHFDPWWNLAAQDQATDRAHRIGQQSHVQVYKLIAKDTIEERILELQDKKASLMETISGADNGGILQMSKEELLALLEIR